MGPMDRKLNASTLEMLGSRCAAKVADVLHRRNYGIFAVGVTDLMDADGTPVNSIDTHPHITIAHSQEVKPREVRWYSDEREWQIVPNLRGLEVQGTLEEL
jgi:hypothetical protein